jgi:hypothetical protein
MPEDSKVEQLERGFFEGLVDALSEKHAQLDIALDHVILKLPGLAEPLDVSGSLSISVHLRDLSQEEKELSARKNLVRLGSSKS